MNSLNLTISASPEQLKRDIDEAIAKVNQGASAMGAANDNMTYAQAALNAQYNDAITKASTLATRYGEQSTEALKAAASAEHLALKIKDQVTAVGLPFQRAAGGANQLGLSINQITREMPAFTYSMQTGFMAISNNIPMLVDQINMLKQRNIELAASGQPVQSVFKQVASALFSWQTVLSVGITLLTVFGAKLFESAFGAKENAKEIEKAAEAQKKLNEEIQEYLRTDKENAIFKENEQYKKVVRELQKQVKVQEYYIDVANRRAIEVGKLTQAEIDNNARLQADIEKATKMHKDNLLEIEKRFEDKKKTVKIAAEKSTYEKIKPSFFGMQFGDTLKEKPKLELSTTAQELDVLNKSAKEAQESVLGAYYSVVGFSKAEFDLTPITKFQYAIEQLSDTLKNSFVNALTSASAALGEALMTGDFEAAGQAIVKQLGGIAIQIGAALIAMGTPMAFAGVPTGYTYLAAGAALAILGGMMQATGKSPNSPPINDVGGNNNNNIQSTQPIFNFTPTASTINFAGMVRGNELVLVTNNQNQINKRTR